MQIGISREELQERLRLGSSVLVKKILAYAEQHWQEALDHKKIRDDKAQKALGFASISLGILFTLATFFAHTIHSPTPSLIFLFLFLVASLCFLLAIFFNFFAFRKQKHLVLNADNILNPGTLKMSEEAEEDSTGLRYYERHMASLFLCLAEEMEAQLEKTAHLWDKAENCFGAGLLFFGLSVVYIAVLKLLGIS